MKKRISSIILTICMVLILLPTTVFAEEPGNYDELQGIMRDARYGGTVTLTKDYTINNTVTVYDTTLDLNGHVIKMTGNGSVIKVDISSNFTLQDSSEGKTGAITGGFTSGYGGGVFVFQGHFTMEGGTIYDCHSSGLGGCVYVGGGSFTMKGGVIDGGSSSAGGGVLIDGSSFTMEGGVIDSGNDFASNSVYVNNLSTFNANGGMVKSFVESEAQINNTATYGGTIFYGASNRFGTINGKTVTFKKDNSTYATEIVAEGNTTAVPEAPTKEGYSFEGWYNGDNKYEFTESVTDNITLTAQWKDIEKPVITVLENQKTYCDEVQFEVSDNDGVASVTANGVTLTPDANNKYTLEKGKGTVTVVAIDKANNQTSVTVTVSDGHTAGNDDGDCSTPVYCIYHPDTVVIEAKSHDFSGDWNKNTDVHWHACQNEGCTVTDTPQPHSGGSATCTAKAECEYCGEEYGELDSSNHTGGTEIRGAKDATCTEEGYTGDTYCIGCGEKISAGIAIKMSAHNLEKIPAKDATVTETGNKEYWQCENCKKYFADEKGTNEICLEDTVIQKLPPEIIKGKGQSVAEGEKKALSFTSNAAYSDFIRVELDGKTLDEKNYIVKEGSTIVTLKADYVATLSAGKHTIGIVSESGTATTTFIVNAKAVVDNDTKSPQTGDNSHMALWIALLLVSGAGVIGTTVYGKKKRAK